MARQMTVALVVLLAATALAGCIGGDDGPEVVISDEAAQARATDETGSVTGQVVTVDLEILAGVEIGLTNRTGGVELTKTDKNGQYTFNDVRPGPYRIQMEDPCCKVTSANVNVVAGAVSEINLQVTRLSSAEQRLPYVVSQQWDGFLACGIAAGGNTDDQCGDDDPNHDVHKYFTVSEGILEIVAALDWDPVPTAVNDQLRFHLHRPGNNTGDDRCGLFLEGGPPPIIQSATETNAQCDDVNFAMINGTMNLEFEIAVAGLPGATYQQAFTVYWHEFYNRNAPLDFNPLPDG